MKGRDRRFLAIGGLALVVGCAPGSDRDGWGTGQTVFSTIRVDSIGVPPGSPEDCPVEVGVVWALAGLESGSDQGKPALRVAIGCSTEGNAGEVLVHTAARLTVAIEGEPDSHYEGFAVGPCPGCWRGQGFLACLAVGRVVREAVIGARDQLSVVASSDEEVIKALSAGQPVSTSVLLTAVGQAGDRRLSGAVEPLIRLLDVEDRNVVLRAIGALGSLGDPAAVRSLGRLSLSRAPETPFAALQALADIGGEEAARVLDLVANQTTDPVVAREALDHLNHLNGAAQP